MSIPKPGTKVRGSQSGAPVNAVFDLLGRRWALGIIWNLGKGPATFRGLQELCDTISPSTLNSRLKDLREADIIERMVEGYQLTSRGRDLWTVLEPVGKWSLVWAKELFGFNFTSRSDSDDALDHS